MTAKKISSVFFALTIFCCIAAEKSAFRRICDTRLPDAAAIAARSRTLSAPSAALAATDDADPCVDILVAFDTGAAAYAEEAGGVTNFARNAVMKMNEALANNELTALFKFRLVGVALVDDARTDIDEALDLVCDSYGRAKGAWKKVQEARETVGADIVCCLVDTGSAYGIAGICY